MYKTNAAKVKIGDKILGSVPRVCFFGKYWKDICNLLNRQVTKIRYLPRILFGIVIFHHTDLFNRDPFDC